MRATTATRLVSQAPTRSEISELITRAARNASRPSDASTTMTTGRAKRTLKNPHAVKRRNTMATIAIATLVSATAVRTHVRQRRQRDDVQMRLDVARSRRDLAVARVDEVRCGLVDGAGNAVRDVMGAPVAERADRLVQWVSAAFEDAGVEGGMQKRENEEEGEGEGGDASRTG